MAGNDRLLQHLLQQQATLPCRPSLAEVQAAREGIAAIDQKLAASLEALLGQLLPDGIDSTSFKKLQALKEDSIGKTAEAERAPLQAVLDLDAQHQHYQRLIAQEEEALVSRPRADPGANLHEPSGSQSLANQEEARTTKLLQVIQRAQEKSSKTLDLSEGFQGSLTWLPESLGHLTELTELDISGQQLQTIPEALAGLSGLRSLNLRSNKLRALPDSVGLLTSLTFLDVSSNNLHDLPATLGRCSSLEVLLLDFNQLPALPETLFHDLRSLRRLSAHLNKLRSLPASIGRLSSLEELDVHFNQLQHIPDEIGACRRLRELNLSSNFASLVRVHDAMGSLVDLESLDLSNNQLESLPLSFGRLRKLRTLLLDGNPLTDPPSPIVTKGAQAVVEYLALQQRLAESAEQGGAAFGWFNGWLGGVAGLGLVEWLQSLLGGVTRMMTTSTGAWLLGWNQTPGPRRIQEPEGRPLEDL